MYSMYTIKPDHITKQSRTRHVYYGHAGHAYYENNEDFEPTWFKYVYSICLFSLTILCIVIIL